MPRGSAGTVAQDPAVHPAGSATAARADAPLPVVFVAGSGHTGSTLLALVMDSHPEIACVGETAVKPKIVVRAGGSGQACSCGATIGECEFWRQVGLLVRAGGVDFSPDRWSNDYRPHNRLALRVLNRLCGSAAGQRLVQWAAEHVPVHSGAIHDKDAANVAFIRAVLQVAGARVFADTSKALNRLTYLVRLHELDLKIITLVRDVRGYAASVKRRGGSVTDAARTWLKDQQGIAAITAGLPADRLHRLHYEDLCGRPADSQAALWRFCGVAPLAPIESLAATDHHVLGNSMRLGGAIRLRLDESWRKRLDAGEARAVLAIAGPMNRAVGYDEK
jgi:hypothetical protein